MRPKVRPTNKSSYNAVSQRFLGRVGRVGRISIGVKICFAIFLYRVWKSVMKLYHFNIYVFSVILSPHYYNNFSGDTLAFEIHLVPIEIASYLSYSAKKTAPVLEKIVGRTF